MVLDLSWAKHCVLIEHHNSIMGGNFKITNIKFYVSVVTLFVNKNTKSLENLKYLKEQFLRPIINLK